jgi:hypothetical protein
MSNDEGGRLVYLREAGHTDYPQEAYDRLALGGRAAEALADENARLPDGSRDAARTARIVAERADEAQRRARARAAAAGRAAS